MKSRMGPAPGAGRGARRLWGLAAAAISGCLLVASYPPFNQGWAAWIALLPLLLLWRAQPSVLAALATAAAGALWGGVLFFPLLFVEGGGLAQRAGGYLLATGAVAAFLTLFCLGFYQVSARTGAFWAAALAPGLWIALEYALRHVAAGFSVYFGVTQWSLPPALAVAAAGGIHAVSGVVVGANALFGLGCEVAFAGLREFAARSPGLIGPPVSSRPLARARHAGLLFAVLGAAAAGLYTTGSDGGWQPAQAWEVHAPQGATAGATLKAVLVQPGFTPSEYSEAAASFDGHRALLEKAAALTDEALRSLEPPQGPTAELRLVVWPETTLHIPVYPFAPLRESLEALAAEHGAYLLAGFPRSPFDPPPYGNAEGDPAPRDRRQRNSAYLFTPAGTSRAVYDKVNVIPIAESHYAPGEEVRPFRVEVAGEQVVLGVGICSDAIEPRHALAAVRGGALVLHYLSSLSRVGTLAELERAFLVFRAVEHGVYVTQAATTGPTLVIDPKGRVVDALLRGGPGVLVVSMPLQRGDTAYTRWGDWPAGVSGSALAVAGLWLFLQDGRRRRTN